MNKTFVGYSLFSVIIQWKANGKTLLFFVEETRVVKTFYILTDLRAGGKNILVLKYIYLVVFGAWQMWSL